MKMPRITNKFFFAFLLGYPLIILGVFYLLYCNEIQLGWVYGLIGLIPLAIIFYFIGIAYCTRYILNNDIDKPEQKPCQYCSGGQAGPYLCSHCKSILWYNIKGKHALETSIFLLEHRWEFISAIGALFVVLPLSLLFTRMSDIKKERETELNENMKSVSILLDNLSVVRSKIHYLESIGSWSYDMKVWSELNSNYTNIYWNLPPTFERLLKSVRAKNSDFDCALNKTKELIHFNEMTEKSSIDTTTENGKKFLKKYRSSDSVLYQRALLLNHPGLRLSGIKEYMEYVNSVSHCQKLIETGKITRKDIDNRKRLAGKTYHRLRVTSMMLRILLDHDWLLNQKKGWRYDSEVADSKFDFKTIFLHNSTSDSLLNSIINLDFHYKARDFDAYNPLDSIMFNNYQPHN